ncbi:MAG: temperature sensitive supressor [Desulfatitalea sp. BRH_c12]|nr:MAG: temperature sensitive supressor [Desulfatitalea sp. BRH_c12]
MSLTNRAPYTALDGPEISRAIFHPRAESALSAVRYGDKDHLIPVTPEVRIGARFHASVANGPNILFFHGNGEIVADYDEVGPLFNRMGINFLAADYRGYGRSGGKPSVSTMLTDSHAILAYVQTWLARKRYGGPLVVMGRSLGSASALELAAAHPGDVKGLIIESGFAYAEPLLRLLGVALDQIGYREDHGFGNIAKIKHFTGPTLIIHAQYDPIIPYSDGLTLYEASTARHKRLLRIDGADHNDIFAKGMDAYLQAVRELASLLQ